MKKFWNLMLVALVMLGAAACTETNESVDASKESLSFYAEISNDATRADLEYDEQNKNWKTVWEGNETIVVKSASQVYNFVNSAEEPAKFTCTEAGVSQLVGQSVNISIASAEQSKVGKRGVTVSVDVEAFDNTKTIKLEATNSFLRYTYNGEGKVALTLTYEGGQAFVYNEGQAYDSVEFEGVKGENWVSFNAPAEKTAAELAYSIDGVEVKRKAINVFAGTIYNLGELTEPQYDSYVNLIPSSEWKCDNAWFAAYFFGANGSKALKLSDADGDGVYMCGVPAGMEKVIFCRMNPDFAEFGWNTGEESETDPKRVWSQTADLEIGVEPNNYYHIIGWDGGAWGTKEGYELPEVPMSDYKIYVHSRNASWGSLNIYLWETGTGNAMANWPGSGYNDVTTIGGFEYFVWDVTKNMEGKSLSIIINDGSQQTPDHELGVFNGNLYLLFEGNAITILEDPADLENPVIPEITPGVATEWALVGVFSGWADKAMVTTTDANVVVLQNVAMKAAEGFLVRKPATEWNDKYGAGNVNYIKANHYITTSKDGADMCLEADGTYDVYFNISTKNLYVMTAGSDYTAAAKQTVSGEEPKQEEPEVTEKVVYLKPNSNWTQSNARFAAYFWNNSGNVWVSMTAVGDGTYEVHLPEGYDYGCNVIFCRMNPSTTANNWNNKWNQTSDLKTPTDGKNMYTVKDGTWDKGGGSWSVK